MSKIIKQSGASNIRAAHYDFADLGARGDAIIARAGERADKIYADAAALLEEAKKISVSAGEDREKAAAEKAKAEEEIAAAVLEARENAFQEGKKAGYETGYAEGLAKGADEAHRDAYEKAFSEKQSFVEEESAPVLEQVSAILNALDAEFESLRSDARSGLMKLTVAIAEKIVRREINVDTTVVLAAVHKAIDLSLKKYTVRVLLNPDDYNVVSQYLSKIRAAFAHVENVELATSPLITHGGCVVESGSGTVDMKIETQLAQIERELLQRG